MKIRYNNDSASGIFEVIKNDNIFKLIDEAGCIVWSKRFKYNIVNIEIVKGNFSSISEIIKFTLSSGDEISYSTQGNLLTSEYNSGNFSNYNEEFNIPIKYFADLIEGYYEVELDVFCSTNFQLYDTRGACIYDGGSSSIKFKTKVLNNELFHIKSYDDIVINNVNIKMCDRLPVVHVIGDSTLANQKLPYFGWAQLLASKLDYVVLNHAIPGRSFKSFDLEGRLDYVLNQIDEGDTLLVGFGHNDEKDNYFGNSPSQYITYINKVLKVCDEKNVFCNIFSPIARRRFIYGILMDTHYEYVKKMKTEGIVFINLSDYVKGLIEKEGLEGSKSLFVHSDLLKLYDDTHLSYKGANLVASYVFKQLNI